MIILRQNNYSLFEDEDFRYGAKLGAIAGFVLGGTSFANTKYNKFVLPAAIIGSVVGSVLGGFGMVRNKENELKT